MNISVVGTGYVGLVTGTCFSEMGNHVICVDIDENKINLLNNGKIPIYEPGLDVLVNKNKGKTLFFTTNLQDALKNSDIVFIAVGTPPGEDGSADLSYVLDVAKSIGKYMEHKLIVVDKSTVPVGTAEKVKATIKKELNKRNKDIEFYIVSNPEFLKEGDAINDFMKPDRIIIGADNDDVIDTMKELYRPFTLNHERFIAMDIRSAELTKYAANAMLATKISFINEIANICEQVGANINMVRIGIGSDHRIGYHFIYPGCGYGGSCFPKDVKALIKIAEESNYNPRILKAVEDVNNDQKKVIIKNIKNYFKDLKGLTFGVWGLSFKPGTDDMREAPAIVIIKELTKLGAKVKAYDPKAIKEAKEIYLKNVDNIEYYNSKYDVLNNSDALILITEWKEFRSPDFLEIKKRLKNPVIFDGRNQYDIKQMKKYGFNYFPIGIKIHNNK